jgi:hypothetical protein
MDKNQNECKNKCEKYDVPKFYSICELCNELFCNNCMYLYCIICQKQYVCFNCGSRERNKSFITGVSYIIKCREHLINRCDTQR